MSGFRVVGNKPFTPLVARVTSGGRKPRVALVVNASVVGSSELNFQRTTPVVVSRKPSTRTIKLSVATRLISIANDFW